MFIQGAVTVAYSNPYLSLLMIIYTVVAYLAITCHMTMIKEFGGIATVIIGNVRKALTIVLSFALFPKPGSWLYILGGVLVFGSLTANAYIKEQDHARKSKGEAERGGVGGSGSTGNGLYHMDAAAGTATKKHVSRESGGRGMIAEGEGEDRVHDDIEKDEDVSAPSNPGAGSRGAIVRRRSLSP